MLKSELAAKLQTTPYSLNFDEASLKNLLHVVPTLVSYFDHTCNTMKVEQVGSLGVPQADAKN